MMQSPQPAVGAIVIKDDRVLFVKRGTRPNKGAWTLPGGRIKIGETLQDAAEREVYEETGIMIKAGNPIYTFDYIEKNMNGEIVFHYIIIDLEAEYVSGQPCPGDDAIDTDWIDAVDFSRLGVNQRVIKLLNDQYGIRE